jgi:hypothetical protein
MASVLQTAPPVLGSFVRNPTKTAGEVKVKQQKAGNSRFREVLFLALNPVK